VISLTLPCLATTVTTWIARARRSDPCQGRQGGPSETFPVPCYSSSTVAIDQFRVQVRESPSDSRRDEPSSQKMPTLKLSYAPLWCRQAQQDLGFERLHLVALGIFQRLSPVIHVPTGRNVNADDGDLVPSNMVQNDMIRRSHGWVKGKACSRRRQMKAWSCERTSCVSAYQRWCP